MVPSISADVTLGVHYSNLALRDHLVEEPPEQTNLLLRSSMAEVAGSNGCEVVMWAPDQEVAKLRIDVWEADPGAGGRGDTYRRSPVLTLEVPSGRLYVSSAPSSLHFLPHPLTTGTYAVRVCRRRLDGGDPGSDGGRNTEEYTIDLWRTGDLPQHWLDLLDDDDD